MVRIKSSSGLGFVTGEFLNFLPVLRSCINILVWQRALEIDDIIQCMLSHFSHVHGVFQARVLEWVAISSFRGLPNPGIEPCLLQLLHCRRVLYCCHQGNMIQSSSSQLRGEWEYHAFCEQGWGVKGWCGEAGVVWESSSPDSIILSPPPDSH